MAYKWHEKQAELLEDFAAFLEVARRTEFNGSLTVHFGQGVPVTIETREHRRLGEKREVRK